MFNINEGNRIVMAQHPCVREPKSDKAAPLGVQRIYGILQATGKRTIPSSDIPVRGEGFRSMPWSELVLLMEGISPELSFLYLQVGSIRMDTFHPLANAHAEHTYQKSVA